MTNDVGRARASMVMDALRGVLGASWRPELYEPGYHHPDAWVIASETGPEGWPSTASYVVNRTPDHGLYVEAVNHWSIAVFPEGTPTGAPLTLAAPDEPEHWNDVAVEHEATAPEHIGQIRMGTADYRRPRKLGW